jgi:hypothetical protein
MCPRSRAGAPGVVLASGVFAQGTTISAASPAVPGGCRPRTPRAIRTRADAGLASREAIRTRHDASLAPRIRVHPRADAMPAAQVPIRPRLHADPASQKVVRLTFEPLSTAAIALCPRSDALLGDRDRHPTTGARTSRSPGAHAPAGACAFGVPGVSPDPVACGLGVPGAFPYPGSARSWSARIVPDRVRCAFGAPRARSTGLDARLDARGRLGQPGQIVFSETRMSLPTRSRAVCATGARARTSSGAWPGAVPGARSAC